jgi:hypothetical protein
MGGSSNIYLGEEAGNLAITGTENTCVGYGSGFSLTTGSQNTAVGYQTLPSCNSSGNSCLGFEALNGVTTGGDNTAVGYAAAGAINSGTFNTALGQQALSAVTTGSFNCCLGYGSGFSLATSDSNNIMIMAQGAGGTNGSIQIGINGTHTTCFIQGISGKTVTGTAVLCSTSGQLGTIASSIRYKENVEDLGNASEDIYNLRPVRFNYKTDPEKKQQYGLIAEEVAKDMDYLCFHGEDNQPDSVKYHELPVLLLAELKKLQARIVVLESRVAA